MSKPNFIAIVFDGPPGPGPCEAHFIEVEKSVLPFDTRKSISFGDWVETTDGKWELRFDENDCKKVFEED